MIYLICTNNLTSFGSSSLFQKNYYLKKFMLKILDAQGSCDNSQILAGGLDKQLSVFDVETGKLTRRWREHNG